MGNNERFEDLMSDINDTANGYGFKNGIDWARYAQSRGEISYSYLKDYEGLHHLRVRYSHGSAKDICISDTTLSKAYRFLKQIRRSRLRKQRINPRVHNGHFRAPSSYIKELNWTGYDGSRYHFKFRITWEYQDRRFSDGTAYKGNGYSIYILDAPYRTWCREHNRDYDFHFYDTSPYRDPTICWNLKITDFSEANQIMLEWAKRYQKLIDSIRQNRHISESELLRAQKRRGVIPRDSFRAQYKKRHRIKKAPTIHIAQSVYNEIMNKLGKEKPEFGGMLGWRDDPSYIDYYIFDQNASTKNDTYTPDVDFLNDIIANEWENQGIYLGGFVHSHPESHGMLSSADINYGKKIAENFDMDFIVLPIVLSSYEYKSQFIPYIVTKNGTVQKCNLEIVSDPKKIKKASESKHNDDDTYNYIKDRFEQMSKNKCTPIYTKEDSPDATIEQVIFDRISPVIDIAYMKNCAIVGVGCGGARSFYENMARLGIGNFYLIDGDTVSLTNVASQNGFISEVDKPKVEMVKKRILDINPYCNVRAINAMLDDDMTDEWLDKEIFSKYKPEQILFCGSTDNFSAQKRCAEIAKKFKIPYLASGHHQYGETSEIFYWYPNVSLYDCEYTFKSRYEAQESGTVKKVSSVGSPIFNTTRLNALCEKIALGILTYNYELDKSPVFSSFLRYEPHRNLIVIRQRDLLLCNNPLEPIFYTGDGYLFDDAVWVDPKELNEENDEEVVKQTTSDEIMQETDEDINQNLSQEVNEEVGE